MISVNKAAVNMGVHIFFWTTVQNNYCSSKTTVLLPHRSGTARSHGSVINKWINKYNFKSLTSQRMNIYKVKMW